MKHLSVQNMFFKLPEDFNGNLPDALRLLADYISLPTPDLLGQCPTEPSEDPWNAYLEVIELGGKVSGTFGLKSLNEAGTEWDSLPL